MTKFASPQELQAALQSVLDYAGGQSPSRAKVAARLLELATKVAGEPRAYSNVTRQLDVLMRLEFDNTDAMRHLNAAYQSIEKAARISKLT